MLLVLDAEGKPVERVSLTPLEVSAVQAAMLTPEAQRTFVMVNHHQLTRNT